MAISRNCQPARALKAWGLWRLWVRAYGRLGVKNVPTAIEDIWLSLSKNECFR
jgi:hypothetical protein